MIILVITIMMMAIINDFSCKVHRRQVKERGFCL